MRFNEILPAVFARTRAYMRVSVCDRFEIYRRNYAKHRLMNAYGRLFGTKVPLYKARVSYLHCGRQNFKLREVLMNLQPPPPKTPYRTYTRADGVWRTERVSFASVNVSGR